MISNSQRTHERMTAMTTMPHPSYGSRKRTALTDAIGTIREWIAARDQILAAEAEIEEELAGLTAADADEERQRCREESQEIARARTEQVACVRGLAGYDTDTLSDALDATRAPRALRDALMRGR